jgi:serine/threonine protein kinase
VFYLQGLQYLHGSSVKYHGDLRSTNCLVNSRWTVRLQNFGPKSLLNEAGPENITDDIAKSIDIDIVYLILIYISKQQKHSMHLEAKSTTVINRLTYKL